MAIFMRLISFLILIIFSLDSLADTVWMKNGDRLTGNVTLLNNSKLIIATDYAGEVTISWDKVSTLETQTPLIVKLSQDKEQKVKTIKPAKEGKLKLINGTNHQEIALNDIQQIIKPKPLVEDLIWSGKIAISLDNKRSDKDTNDFDVDFQTKLLHSNWRHTLTGEFNRKSTDGHVSTNNYQLDYTLDHFITKQWFWQTNGNFKLDHIEDLRKQYTLGTGPGYQFWDDSLGSFSLASLVNLSHYEYRDKSNTNFGAYGIRWNYDRYWLGKNIEFFTTGDLFRPLRSEVGNYTLDTNVGIRYKLTDWASLNFRINRNIVDAESDANINETRYIFGFGINW